MELVTEGRTAIPPQYFLNKRRAIELGHLTSWARLGRAYIHPENEWLVRSAIRTFLNLVGLLERGQQNARWPVVSAVDLTFRNLPCAFHGFRILHLSDLHADGIDGLADCLASLIRDLQVDLCVLTGDYRFEVDGPCQAVYPLMETIVASAQSRHGIAGILGNHDSIEMVRPLERMGVRMLMNQSWEITRGGESIWVLGLDDPNYYGCDDLTGTCSDVPGDAFKILLVHSPELVPEAAAHGINLYLCGHTHGGQICLPAIGPVFLNARCPRRFTRGHWRHDEMQGYTNRGVGSSGVPVRFNCPPEVAVVTLLDEKMATTNNHQAF